MHAKFGAFFMQNLAHVERYLNIRWGSSVFPFFYGDITLNHGLSDPLEGLGHLFKMLIHHEFKSVLIFINRFESFKHVSLVEVYKPLEVVDPFRDSSNLFYLTVIFNDFRKINFDLNFRLKTIFVLTSL